MALVRPPTEALGHISHKGPRGTSQARGVAPMTPYQATCFWSWWWGEVRSLAAAQWHADKRDKDPDSAGRASYRDARRPIRPPHWADVLVGGPSSPAYWLWQATQSPPLLEALSAWCEGARLSRRQSRMVHEFLSAAMDRAGLYHKVQADAAATYSDYAPTPHPRRGEGDIARLVRRAREFLGQPTQSTRARTPRRHAHIDWAELAHLAESEAHKAVHKEARETPRQAVKGKGGRWR